MSSFPIIATVLSMVLGLSVTRLLLGLVTVFRIRHTSPVDWIPLAWSGILFAAQLEFWWAVNQLPGLKQDFQFHEFVFLVLLTLMLFVSAALLLPSRNEDETDGLRLYFDRDGRYGLLALAGFLILAFLLNAFYFRIAEDYTWMLLDVPMILLPLAVFGTRSRSARAAMTAAYVPLSALDIWISLAA